MSNFHFSFCLDVGIPNLLITAIVIIILFCNPSLFTQVAFKNNEVKINCSLRLVWHFWKLLVTTQNSAKPQPRITSLAYAHQKRKFSSFVMRCVRKRKKQAGKEREATFVECSLSSLAFYQMFSHISNSFLLFCTTHHKCESCPIFRWGDQNLGILHYWARGHRWQASELQVESRPTLLWSIGAFHSHHVSRSTSQLAARHRHGSVTPSGSGWEDSLPQWPKRMSVGHGGALPHSLL